MNETPALAVILEQMRSRGDALALDDEDLKAAQAHIDDAQGRELAKTIGQLVAFSMWLKSEGADDASGALLSLLEANVPRLRELSQELADQVAAAVASKTDTVTGREKVRFSGHKAPAKGQVGAGPLARFQLDD